MRITQKQKHTNRNVIITVMAVILVASALYVWFNPNISFIGLKSKQVAPENTVDYNKATDEQKAAGETQKKATAPPNVDTKQNQDNESSNVVNTSQVNVSITALNVAQGMVQVRTLVSVVDNSGTCTLVLTKGNTTVTKRSGIQAGPSSSTCKGFDIPTNELSSGEWKLTITVDVNGQKANATQLFTV